VRLARPVTGAPPGIAAVEVTLVSEGRVLRQTDLLSVEEPLEIRVVYGPEQQRIERSISVTMRTPGDDLALALGFLHGEGVVRSMDDIVDVARVEPPVLGPSTGNVVRVELAPAADFDADELTRHVYTTSSCGVCGKASIDAVRVHIPDHAGRDTFAIDHGVLGRLPKQLQRRQHEFSRTGGLHASAAFRADGKIDAVAEDVGRHNALDKIIGSYLSKGRLPMSDLGLIVSGRASFELVQKAAMAGCPFVAAIGPPSSLAVELAAEQRMTLVGFLREDRCNVYTLPHRVLVGT
jgi:FdhD protein